MFCKYCNKKLLKKYPGNKNLNKIYICSQCNYVYNKNNGILEIKYKELLFLIDDSDDVIYVEFNEVSFFIKNITFNAKNIEQLYNKAIKLINLQ